MQVQVRHAGVPSVPNVSFLLILLLLLVRRKKMRERKASALGIRHSLVSIAPRTRSAAPTESAHFSLDFVAIVVRVLVRFEFSQFRPYCERRELDCAQGSAFR